MADDSRSKVDDAQNIKIIQPCDPEWSGLSVDRNSVEIPANIVEMASKSEKNPNLDLSSNSTSSDSKKLDDTTVGTDDLKKWPISSHQPSDGVPLANEADVGRRVLRKYSQQQELQQQREQLKGWATVGVITNFKPICKTIVHNLLEIGRQIGDEMVSPNVNKETADNWDILFGNGDVENYDARQLKEGLEAYDNIQSSLNEQTILELTEDHLNINSYPPGMKKKKITHSKEAIEDKSGGIKRGRPSTSKSFSYNEDEEGLLNDSDVDGIVCQVCNSGDDEENILLCDECDRGCHLACAMPPLLVCPSEDWFCHICIIPGFIKRESKSVKKENGSSRGKYKKKVKKEEEEEVDDVVCQVCDSGDNEENILLCDECDRGCHLACAVPPLLELPEGDWFCQTCVILVSERKESNSAKKQRKENKDKEKSKKVSKMKRKSEGGDEQILPLICKLCDKKFKSQGGYDYHVKNVCVQEGDDDLKKNFSERVKRVCMEHGEGEDGGVALTCKVCDKQFKSQGGYEYHVENVCGDKKNGSSRKSEGKGENDEEEEDGDEQEYNPSNSYKRKRKESSSSNGDIKEGKENIKFVCEKCTKSFKSEGGHKYHMANVCNTKVEEEGKEGSVKFYCDVCGKKFKSEGGYKYHMANVCNDKTAKIEGEKERDAMVVTEGGGEAVGGEIVEGTKLVEAVKSNIRLDEVVVDNGKADEAVEDNGKAHEVVEDNGKAHEVVESIVELDEAVEVDVEAQEVVEGSIKMDEEVEGYVQLDCNM